ncbi:MAG: 4Fe-4S binding protein [Paludibacteraceae bacterium]|nr:4Fe-4S binding protein [Paludibacteraceae bacterium]
MTPKRFIIAEKCGKHNCKIVGICPVQAFHQLPGEVPTIDQDACIRCGICERACPNGAVGQTRDED